MFRKRRSKATLLLVDDDASLRDLLKLILENQGFQVATAESGERALEFFQEHSADIDLVILDQVMPGMTGTETLHELRLRRQDVPAILKTVHPDVDEPSLIAAGFFCIYKPPFDLSALISSIHNALRLE